MNHQPQRPANPRRPDRQFSAPAEHSQRLGGWAAATSGGATGAAARLPGPRDLCRTRLVGRWPAAAKHPLAACQHAGRHLASAQPARTRPGSHPGRGRPRQPARTTAGRVTFGATAGRAGRRLQRRTSAVAAPDARACRSVVMRVIAKACGTEGADRRAVRPPPQCRTPNCAQRGSTAPPSSISATGRGHGVAGARRWADCGISRG